MVWQFSVGGSEEVRIPSPPARSVAGLADVSAAVPAVPVQGFLDALGLDLVEYGRPLLPPRLSLPVVVRLGCLGFTESFLPFGVGEWAGQGPGRDSHLGGSFSFLYLLFHAVHSFAQVLFKVGKGRVRVRRGEVEGLDVEDAQQAAGWRVPPVGRFADARRICCWSRRIASPLSPWAPPARSEVLAPLRRRIEEFFNLLVAESGKGAEVGRVVVGGFVEAVLERVRDARAAVQAALEAEDAYGVAVAQEELDDALRLASDHGIDVRAEEGERGAGSAV
uniref:hypothetical protein n=1 Tax=Streptomyces lunaelactis TaxID=1535768 RepID=UPI0020C74FA2|nr:hypothetical protein [Streptomyces lunaelactis]